MRLGAGRSRKEDSIDPAVGVVLKARAGQQLAAGDPLAVLHVNDATHLPLAQQLVEQAFQWSEQPVAPGPLVREVIS